MSDARWIEILDDVAWSVEHFSRAVEIDRAGGFEGDHLEAYKARMALMQAMQAGHTSLEAALERSECGRIAAAMVELLLLLPRPLALPRRACMLVRCIVVMVCRCCCCCEEKGRRLCAAVQAQATARS